MHHLHARVNLIRFHCCSRCRSAGAQMSLLWPVTAHAPDTVLERNSTWLALGSHSLHASLLLSQGLLRMRTELQRNNYALLPWFP